jgi:hypothetical protein
MDEHPGHDGRGGPEVPRAPDQRERPLDAVPGLARIAASAWLHTTEWGLRTTAHTAGRLARAATDRGEAEALAQDVGESAHAVAAVARTLSAGVPLPTVLARITAAVEGRGDPGGGGLEARSAPASTAGGAAGASTAEGAGRASTAEGADGLRRRGRELLEKSRDVWNTDASHPAYERILGDLAPDEARVLVLLLRDGPQPSVDVRTGGPIGMVSSTLVAPGLTMIGARAGCRYADQVPAYLNNLYRLGLVWFSREPLRDPLEYQVVEAQPDVLAAMHSVKFAKVVRRSIHLTPFGDDFCRSCFLDAQAPTADLPEHESPPEDESAAEAPRSGG